jgi:hypothetical protein
MSMARQSRLVLFAVTLLLFCGLALPARADSVGYNVAGYFSDGSSSQYFGGVVDWNAKTHEVTGYTLTLGTSTFTCSGFCNIVIKNFQGSGKNELLLGFFNPKNTSFTLSGWGSGKHFLFKLDHMAWTQVRVPDAPALAELFCVLAFLGLMIPRARLLRRQS